MKTLIGSIVALFAFAAVAQAGNLLSSSGSAVRSSHGGCVLTSDGVNNLAECEAGEGPGKG